MTTVSRYTSAYVESREGRFVVTMVDRDGNWWTCGHRHRGALNAAACESRIKRQTITVAAATKPFAHDDEGRLIAVSDSGGTVHVVPRQEGARGA